MSSNSSSNAGLSEALSSLNIGDGEMNNEERDAIFKYNNTKVKIAVYV